MKHLSNSETSLRSLWRWLWNCGPESRCERDCVRCKWKTTPATTDTFSSSRFQLCVLTGARSVTDSFGTCDIKWYLSFNSGCGGKEWKTEIKLICHGSRYAAKPDFGCLQDKPTNSARFVKYYLWDLRHALKAFPSDCFQRGERKWKRKISLCNSKAFNVTKRSRRLSNRKTRIFQTKFIEILIIKRKPHGARMWAFGEGSWEQNNKIWQQQVSCYRRLPRVPSVAKVFTFNSL